MYKLWPLTCSFVKGTFCNEKWCFLYPVVCELVPLYGSDGIWNKYNTIFWGHSSHSIGVFWIQKRIIRIMINSTNRALCRSLFGELCILPLQAQYILSVCIFIITNMEVFKFNSQVHKFNTRSTHDLYYHQANLPQFQKGICYMGVKILSRKLRLTTVGDPPRWPRDTPLST
jgi:hypothetical protein